MIAIECLCGKAHRGPDQICQDCIDNNGPTHPITIDILTTIDMNKWIESNPELAKLIWEINGLTNGQD